MELREYQNELVNGFWNSWRGNPRNVPLGVAPCGSGKSVVLSKMCDVVLKHRPKFKIWIVSHKAKIIEQNARHLQKMLGIPIGIFAAKLGQKTIRSVTCATINSIFKKDIHADLIVVDEAHLLSGNDSSMYGKFIARAQRTNPEVKICGLTGSPFRLDQGYLIGKDSFFTDIACEIPIPRLIEEGWLAPLISMPSKERFDLTGIKKSGGDFVQSEVEKRMFPFIESHCDEMIEKGYDRKHWVIFCSGIEHAKVMAVALTAKGIPAAHIASDMPHFQQEMTLNRFYSGELRAICNVEMLTIGWDYPAADLLALCRSTTSPALLIQIVGRVGRIAEGKKNGLILDFGENFRRLGCIDCITVKRKTKDGEAEVGKAPTKECPQCGAIWAIRTIKCACGHIFSRESMIAPKADTAPVLSQPELMEVDSIEYKIHKKEGSPPMLRINYRCGAAWVMDFLCFEHGGYAAQMARKKWAMLGGLPQVASTEDAFNRTFELKKPAEIEVKREGKYYRVLRITKEREAEEPHPLQEKYNF